MGSVMKRVLIVTYHFPPRPTIGSVRLRGLAKYLPEFGWQPVILTPELPDDPEPGIEVVQTQYHDIARRWKNRLGFSPDEMLRQQIETASSSKFKTLKGRINKYMAKVGSDIIAYPDRERDWYRFACAAGNEVMRQGNICAMISSSLPATCHLIARDIKTRWNVPWIADLRDPWTQGTYYSNNHTFLRRQMERKLELRTLSKADALVTVSRPWVQDLRELHNRDTVYEILNGFDPTEARSNPLTRLTSEFTITFTGSLYNCLMDPSGLFEAVRDLVCDGVMESPHVQIRFYGRSEACLMRLIEHYGVQEIAKYHGLVPREISLEKQRESQILLLLNWSTKSGIGLYPAKLFEYLAAKRPILSIGKAGGVVEELLNRTNAGVYAPTVSDIRNFLRRCYSEYKSEKKVNYRGRKLEVDKYNQREMVSKFSEILERLV